MKWVKLFEDFRVTFIGYHCSDSLYKGYNGDISSDYFDRFEAILNLIKNNFEKANYFLKEINKNGIEYDSELSLEIEQFFKEIQLKWIFIDEEEPLLRYGKNCYSVYFPNINDTFNIRDYNETDSDYSYVYFYFVGNDPILKKINNI